MPGNRHTSCVKDKDIPKPSKLKNSKLKKGDYPIRLSAQAAAKTALYIAMKKFGLSNFELTRRLGTDEKETRRMIDSWHSTKLPKIEMALFVSMEKVLPDILSVSLLTKERENHF